MGAWADHTLPISYLEGYSKDFEIVDEELTEAADPTYKVAKANVCMYLSDPLGQYIIQVAAGNLETFFDQLAANASLHGHLNQLLALEYARLRYADCSKREGDKWDKKADDAQMLLKSAIKGFANVAAGVLGLATTTGRTASISAAAHSVGGWGIRPW